MWIVDDDGEMFNTDHYSRMYHNNSRHPSDIHMIQEPHGEIHIFKLTDGLTGEERLTRYHDLVEKLTGERSDG